MVTRVVTWTSGSPTTEYNTYADLISQDTVANTSTVHTFIQAINRGNTSSFSGTTGQQKATIGGKPAGSHTSTMPSGIATGGQRWDDGPSTIVMPHNSSGHRARDTIIQTISGWFSNSSSGLGPVYPDIAGYPGEVPPGVVSNITATSVELDWGPPTDTGGSAIVAFSFLRMKNNDFPSAVQIDYDITDLDTGSLGYKLKNKFPVINLDPSTFYTWEIFAKNAAGNYTQLGSYANNAYTNTPVHVKIGGVYKYAGVYIKIAGTYRLVIPYSKTGGIYKALT